MHPLQGIPDDLDLRPRVGTASPSIAPTVVARGVDVETALRRVQAQHSIAKGRILEWHRQNRDVSWRHKPTVVGTYSDWFK